MITGILGRLVSPLVAVPLILAALAGLYGWGYLKGFTTAKERSAILFERSLMKAQQEADHRAQEAIDAAEDLAPIGDADDALLRLCREDASCRARKG